MKKKIDLRRLTPPGNVDEREWEEALRMLRVIVNANIRQFPLSVERDDLIQDGLLGLIQAGQRFDPERGNKFNTYAYYRVTGEILDDLRQYDTLSRGERALVNQGLRPDQKPVRVPFEQAAHVPDPYTASPEVSAGQQELLQIIQVAVAKLEPPLPRLYALLFMEGKDSTQAAMVLGLSKSWVSRLRARLVAEMQTALREAAPDLV